MSAQTAIAGTQPKLALVEDAGSFRATQAEGPGAAHLQACEELGSQMADYCRTYVELTAAEPKEALLVGLNLLRSKRWCSDALNVWIMRKVAQQLDTPSLRIHAGTATWFECDQLPYWMDPVGPPRQRVLSRVEQIRARYQAGRK